jgi:hypothetical protein
VGWLADGRGRPRPLVCLLSPQAGLGVPSVLLNALRLRELTRPLPRETPMTWHPIETAPRDGRAVLVYIPDADPGERLTTVYWLGDYWELCQIGDPSDASHPQSEPTHWMELPDAP